MISLRMNNYWQMIFQLLMPVLVKMVADFSLNIAAGPNCLESTGIKTKTATTTTQQDEAADVSRFPVVSNEDIEKLKCVAITQNTSCSTKQWMNVFNAPPAILKSTLKQWHPTNSTRS